MAFEEIAGKLRDPLILVFFFKPQLWSLIQIRKLARKGDVYSKQTVMTIQETKRQFKEKLKLQEFQLIKESGKSVRKAIG